MPVQERADLEKIKKAAVRSGVQWRTTTRSWRESGIPVFALLGEASHGTHEFYRHRAEITKRLIAEEYYRAMFRGRVSSWNLRDQHMTETLESLFNYLRRRDGHAKIVVWAHNSHLGDARWTDMGRGGEWNIGQLARERYGREAVLVGFTTYTGTVTAASDWNSPAERKRVRSALPDSYEALFHSLGIPGFVLTLSDESSSLVEIPEPLLERAIGVVYMPETERVSHYFYAKLTSQFDSVLHFDVTRAVEPLDLNPEWESGEWETFPSGI